jgi:Tol biopolymer transport system component/DNA-binding winged helix-turn-helix (wHTH) protein
MKDGKNQRYRFENVEINVQNLRVTVDSEIRPLEPKSFRLLLLLVENPDRVLSKEEIMGVVWPGAFVSDNSLARAVAQIRKALDDDSKSPKYVETVPSVGYRFIAEVEQGSCGDTSSTPGAALNEFSAAPAGSHLSPATQYPDVVRESQNQPDSSVSAKSRRGWTLLAAVVILVALVAAGFLWKDRHNATFNRVLAPVRLSKVTYFPGEECDPAFSPDGGSIAFSWNGERVSNSNIYAMSVGGHIPIQLTRGTANDLSPAWSPDGRQIAFLRRETVAKGKLMLVPAGGGAERIVRDVRIKDDIYRVMRPLLTWTPDGSGIVYTAQDDDTEQASLYLADREGKSARKLIAAEEASMGVTAPAFTRDAKWLAYTVVYGPYQARLFVRPLAAGLSARGEASSVTEAVGGLIMSPVWSPDGQRLVFTRNSSIFEWEPGRSPRRIYIGHDFAAMSAAWGPGQSLRVVTADIYAHSADLRAIPLRPGGLQAAGDSAPFASYTGQSSPGVSPDGKSFVFHSRRSGAPEIWVMDENGQNARQLTHLNTADMGYARWSRDGKHIAFHASLGLKPQIFTLDMERISSMAGDGKPGDAVRKITDSAFGFYSPTWSTDGKYIYANRATGARIFRIPAEGGTPEDLFEGAVGMVTTDGHGIVYAKIGHLGIFMRSLDGDAATNSEEKLVDDYRPPGADLNPVSDGVYYISWNGTGKPRAVRFYNYAQKKAVDVAPLPGRIPDTPGLAVTPDRRRIVYSVFTETGKDLTLIEFR